MREGSLDAPTRHPIPWNDPDFYDEAKLDEELRRVFDICHTCRRCLRLCDSFPRLFDLIDESPSGELDTVDSKGFKPVVDACTLCDMCFMASCPYVPPHEWNIDFPHLMLRYRAVEKRKGEGTGFVERQIAETDRNGRMACHISSIANWASDRENGLVRGAMEKVAGIDRAADLPKYAAKPFVKQAAEHPPEINKNAPGYGRKAVLYATCFANYNTPSIGHATRAVLARNGVETEVVYPQCCGMPQLEEGDIARVADGAKKVAAELGPWIDKGYDVVALVPSCALMLKFEWPLILPEDEAVAKLSQATFDASEYVVDIAGKEGLAEGLRPLDGGGVLHIACHARAQNIGRKAAEMMKLVPDTETQVIERCSGHGGAWGVRKGNFETAMKIGKPVARQALKANQPFVASECPLAGAHILQGMERLIREGGQEGDPTPPRNSQHPIELFARAYGIET
ncbi:MAG: heterodisulfide reductase-related iron-sulfur binding cluster [Proteobacteria bacterium]|nr:heterodisulfide reductase-related iron-sulfur binding cluster [Pseudomonadota bacterium]